MKKNACVTFDPFSDKRKEYNMNYGFFRVGAYTPKLRVADPAYNAERILEALTYCHEQNVGFVAFPELSLTGYTCQDLFFSHTLRSAAEKALLTLIDASSNLSPIFVVGLPIEHRNKLYNCAAVVHGGVLYGFVPKIHLPNYGEFYERRHFASGPSRGEVLFAGRTYPFGTNQIFTIKDMPEFRLCVEICEDLWVPSPPSARHAVAGATVIANLSASDETVMKESYRRLLVSSQSARLIATYIYADAGLGESTTDMVFAGHNLIAENGRMLKESKLFSDGLVAADTDLQLLCQERIHQSTFPDQVTEDGDDYLYHEIPYIPRDTDLLRDIAPYPFVPSDPTERNRRCEEILSIQASGLAKRLSHTGCKNVVIGMSGGLDSTLAALVCTRAFEKLELPLEGIIAVTMPGFGTTDRTYRNAVMLAKAFGATLREISISDAVLLHFRDIGHDPTVLDITYENSQARERTQILMDLANQVGGLVIGTGDLSELALGWATYNGDHMSMYAVNSSIPKTLVRYLVGYAATISTPSVAAVLMDVLDTPVSPELLPHDDGRITQVTEDIVGPYALHDFFLYYLMRYGFSPEKILYLACAAFDGEYDKDFIQKWLKIFIRRFFSQQFKRSCLPDGPKVGSVTLSPRSDWRMPSDASVSAWLDSLQQP